MNAFWSKGLRRAIAYTLPFALGSWAILGWVSHLQFKTYIQNQGENHSITVARAIANRVAYHINSPVSELRKQTKNFTNKHPEISGFVLMDEFGRTLVRRKWRQIRTFDVFNVWNEKSGEGTSRNRMIVERSDENRFLHIMIPVVDNATQSMRGIFGFQFDLESLRMRESNSQANILFAQFLFALIPLFVFGFSVFHIFSHRLNFMIRMINLGHKERIPEDTDEIGELSEMIKKKMQ
jgi:hypothetical protein